MRTGSIASLFTLALPLLADAPALAQGTDAQRAACSGDAFRLCASSMPNSDKVAACLYREKDRLSPACRGVFEAADGGKPGGEAAKAPPPAKDAVTAAPPADTASEPAPKDSATAAAPAETAPTPAPADTAKVAPPTPVAAAPNADVVRARSRAASVAPRVAARSTPRPVAASRSAAAKPATRQTARTAPASRLVIRHRRGPRDTDLAQARYWMKRITGVSIGNLAGLLPN